MSDQAKKKLSEVERRATEKLLREFKALHKRLQKRIKKLTDDIETRQKEGEITTSFLFQRQRLQSVLDDVAEEIRRIAKPNALVISTAQEDALSIAREDAQRLLRAESGGMVFRTDTRAIREIIDAAQDKTPLADRLAGLDKPVSVQVKNILIDGVATGQGARRIASRLSGAIGSATVRTLTTARTETNSAYRRATVEHYKTNNDIVDGYIWLSDKSLRTCIICWQRHGKIYPLKTKPNTHPNCRCTMVPYLGESSKIPTGAEEFGKLTDAQQKAILGPERFGLYKRGLTLDDFVADKKTKYGVQPSIVPLNKLPEPPRPAAPIIPKPEPQPKQPPTPKATSAQAITKLETVEKYFSAKQEELQKAMTRAILNTEKTADEIMANAARIRELTAEQMKIADLKAQAMLRILEVANPTTLTVTADSAFRGLQKTRLMGAIRDFKSLVSNDALTGGKITAVGIKSRRAYQRGARIYIPAADARPRSIVHELAHVLETRGNGILRQAERFYEYRTAGEVEQPLSKLIPGSGYGRSERAKPDKFFSPYCGKVYKRDTSIIATEIVSMGVERYHKEPLAFAQEDREYFDFIFKIVRGEIWSPPKSKVKK